MNSCPYLRDVPTSQQLHRKSLENVNCETTAKHGYPRRPRLSTDEEGASQVSKAGPTGCAPSSALAASSAERGNRNGGTGDTCSATSVGEMVNGRINDFAGQGYEVKDDHFGLKGKDDEEEGESRLDRSGRGRDSRGGRDGRSGASLAAGDVRSMVPGSAVPLFLEVRASFVVGRVVRHGKVYVCVY